MPSNPGAMLSATEAPHLLRRTGFSAPPDRVKELLGPPALTRAAAADLILGARRTRFKPHGRSIENVHDKWIRHMIRTKNPLQERLVLFWHDHFATVDNKQPRVMSNQNGLLRQFCLGNFKDFVKAINKDAAMIEFLDTVRNHRELPNENYARELQELFTLGVKDYNGNPNYAQEDVVQIARAFTGWAYDTRGAAVFDTDRHDYTIDYPLRGPKVIYKTRGGFGPGGQNYAPTAADEGAPEIDAVIDIIFDHIDSDGRKTVARHIAGKLFIYLAQPYPKRPAQPALKPVVDELLADSNFDTTWSISALIKAIIINDAFYATDASAPFLGTDLKSIKWPVDYVVSTLRLLKMKLKGSTQFVNGGSYDQIRDQLTNMGQTLLQPPSVFGWNWETAWISSAALLARAAFARDLTTARGGGTTCFHPEKLIDVRNLTDPNAILMAVTDVLGVTDQLTPAEQAKLIKYLTDNGANSSLDLTDYDTRNSKLNGLFCLVLQSPVYQLH